jgi:molecular chaperone DnaK
VYQTEKLLKDQADKVTDDDKAKIEAALGELKEALAGEDVDAIKAKHEALIQASQEFAQRLYQAAQQQQQAAGGDAGAAGGAQQPSDDEVADAEIVDEGEERSA